MEVRKICQWCGKPFIAKKTRLAIAVISAPILVTKNVSGNVNAR